MLRTLRDSLGPTRLWNLAGLLIGTGIASTVLQVAFPGQDWLVSAQMGLLLVFLGGAFLIVLGVFAPSTQRRLMFTVLPALAAAFLGLVIPGLSRLFFGVAVGWLVVSQILLRNPEKREYKLAVKALRKNNYPAAIEIMSQLIEQEPEAAEHYAFRAQLYRLNNDLARAEADYQQTLQLSPQSPSGPNGLSEIYLQRNDLTQARAWAEQAYQRAPKEWVVVYNLGMIAERQGENKNALRYLRQALELGMNESRHRHLAQLWIARICYRTGKSLDAEIALVALRKERKGMHEWEVTLKSEESAQLRTVFQQDVRLAKALMEGSALKDVFVTSG